MFDRLTRSPIYVAIFLFSLVLPQLLAIDAQFIKGFRPLRHEPTRVPLSWDMFANTVQRCTLAWDPPIHVFGLTFSSFKDLGARMEWNVVYDRAEDYRAAARWICRVSRKPIWIKLHCFFPNGSEDKSDYHCG